MANNGAKDTDYVVGLDIGTSKVVCIIGKYVDQHSIEVISMGSYPSSGLKKGVVVNIDATTDAIQKSIDQAQASFEGKIKNVYVGIAGNHIRSLNSHGMEKRASCGLWPMSVVTAACHWRRARETPSVLCAAITRGPMAMTVPFYAHHACSTQALMPKAASCPSTKSSFGTALST